MPTRGELDSVRQYRHIASQAARAAGINPRLFRRQMRQEAGFRDATSPAGAQGPAQIMPATAASWGVHNVHDPHEAYHAAAQHMATYLHQFGGSWAKALTAYNAGPAAVGGHLPAETQNYIATILRGGDHVETPGKPHAPQGGSSKYALTGRLGTVKPGTPPSITPGGETLDTKGAMLAALLDHRKGMKLLDRYQLAVSSGGYTTNTPTTVNAGQGAKYLKGQKITVTGKDAPPSPAGGGKQTAAKAGQPVANLTSIGALHPTAGLDGYMAHDYMAPAGSAAVAPVTGKIIKVSGHDPAAGPTDGPHGPFGLSVYVQGRDGRTYYLTHMGTRTVKVGQTVRQGQKIGTVGNYAKWGGANHIHMGVH